MVESWGRSGITNHIFFLFSDMILIVSNCFGTGGIFPLLQTYNIGSAD